MPLRIGLVVIVCSAFAVQVANAAPEKRCGELGGNCVCSEPLSADQNIAFAESHHDPNDSDVKECGGALKNGKSIYTKYPRASFVPVSVARGTGMPTGSTVKRVLAYETHSVVNVSGSLNAHKPSTRRQCFRTYQRFSKDYSSTAVALSNCQPGRPNYEDHNGDGHPDCCERNKMLRILSEKPVDNFGLQVEDDGFKWLTLWLVRDPATGKSKIATKLDRHGSEKFKMDDCKNHWCRFEVCITGDLSTGTNVDVEMKITQVGGTKAQHFTNPKGPASGIRAQGLSKIWMPDMFRQQNQNARKDSLYPGYPGTRCTGTRFVSHSMQAQWDTDNGQWIGPAYEIEGGGSSTEPLPIDLGKPGRPILVE